MRTRRRNSKALRPPEASSATPAWRASLSAAASAGSRRRRGSAATTCGRCRHGRRADRPRVEQGESRPLLGADPRGGNFGVATSFLFRAHPASMVYGGPIVFELADAPAVMRWYRQFYMFPGLQSVPPPDQFPKEHWSKKMRALLVPHNGPIAEGEMAVNAIRAALPKPIIDWTGTMPYTALQSLFDGSTPRVCNGTGRAISSRLCRTRRSRRMCRTRRNFPASFPRCTFITSMAQCAAKRWIRLCGAVATRHGRW